MSCSEPDQLFSCADLTCTPLTIRLCATCFSRCSSSASLAALAIDATEIGEHHNEMFQEEGLVTSPSATCAVCLVEEAGWRRGVRRAFSVISGALALYVLWLRLAPQATALRHLATIVRLVGKAFRYRVVNMEAAAASVPAIVYMRLIFEPLSMQQTKHGEPLASQLAQTVSN